MSASVIWTFMSIGNILISPLRTCLAKMMIANINVLGPWAQSLGSLVSSRAPGLSSNTLQYTKDLVQMTWKSRPLIFCSRFIIGMTSHNACDIVMYSASVVESATCD